METDQTNNISEKVYKSEYLKIECCSTFLSLKWKDLNRNFSAKIPYVFLRDNCSNNFHPTTFQRLLPVNKKIWYIIIR